MGVIVDTGYHMLHLFTVLDVPNGFHTIVLFVQILKLVHKFLVGLQGLYLLNPHLPLPLFGHSQQNVIPIGGTGLDYWLKQSMKLLDQKVTLICLERIFLNSLGSHRSLLLFFHIFQTGKLLFTSLLLSLHVLLILITPLGVLFCQIIREFIRPCHLAIPGFPYTKSSMGLYNLFFQWLIVIYSFCQERRDSFGSDRVRLCVQLTTLTGNPCSHILG